MKKCKLIGLMALLPLVLGGCQFRPLEDMEFQTDIQVAVDINAVLNVTCDIYNELIPIPPIESEVFRVEESLKSMDRNPVVRQPLPFI